MKKRELYEALQGLFKMVEGNTCMHEETHRGGAIWTICSSCGKKWADDKGGFMPHQDPWEMTVARMAINEYEQECRYGPSKS